MLSLVKQGSIGSGIGSCLNLDGGGGEEAKGKTIKQII